MLGCAGQLEGRSYLDGRRRCGCTAEELSSPSDWSDVLVFRGSVADVGNQLATAVDARVLISKEVPMPTDVAAAEARGQRSSCQA